MPDNRAASTPPRVSVVMPLYNKAPYVLAALRSVQAQTFRDFEIIVVDDGSTDGGAELVEGIEEPRLRLLRQANAGAGAARNAGIRAARGHWVAFLDADDAWLPERLARQLAVLERHPDLVWAAGAYETATTDDSSGQVSPPLSEAWFVAPEVVGDALAVLAAAARHVWTGTIMVRRELLLELRGFEPALRSGQDLFLWTRIAVRHPRLVYVSAPLAAYRTDVSSSITSRKIFDGTTTDIDFARRLMMMSRGVSPERSVMLQTMARRLVITQAKNQFVAGRFSDARTTLAAARLLGLEAGVRGLALATYLPAGPTALACRLSIRLRQRLRLMARGLGS